MLSQLFEQSIAIANRSNAREPQTCKIVNCRGKEEIMAADGRQKEARSTVCVKPRSEDVYKSFEKLACFDLLKILKHAF